MIVHDVFNVAGYKAPRDLVLQPDAGIRGFGYDASTFDL